MEASLLNITNTLKGSFVEIDPIPQGTVRPFDLFRIPGVPFNLRATMVFADRPGLSGAAGINSVLLLRGVVSPPALPAPAPAPIIQYANTNGPIPDILNNVQKLVWNNMPPGAPSLEVEVRAVTPGGGRQRFSIVWYVD